MPPADSCTTLASNNDDTWQSVHVTKLSEIDNISPTDQLILNISCSESLNNVNQVRCDCIGSEDLAGVGVSQVAEQSPQREEQPRSNISGQSSLRTQPKLSSEEYEEAFSWI